MDIAIRRAFRFFFRHLLQIPLSIHIPAVAAHYCPGRAGIYLDRFLLGFATGQGPTIRPKRFQNLCIHTLVARPDMAVRRARWTGVRYGSLRGGCPGFVGAARLSILSLRAENSGEAK